MKPCESQNGASAEVVISGHMLLVNVQIDGDKAQMLRGSHKAIEQGTEMLECSSRGGAW